MSTYYTQVNKAPLKYFDEYGEYMKTTVQSINKVNIPNSFDIPFVRASVGLFNLIISRMMYWSSFDKHRQERHHQVAQDMIYLPAHQISNSINRCESQSYNIIRSLERIFDIKVSRAHEQFGANTFTLSHRVNEFLHIFTNEKLQQFIDKYEIDPLDQYSLRQIYNYRVVRPTDNNLTPEEQKEFKSFIKASKHRNFLHYCAQNNKSYAARIEEIEAHIELLSDLQLRQLQRIKQMLAEGVTKLQNYFHWTVIRIQQFVSMMLLKNKSNKVKSKQEAKSHTNSESNVKETAQHKAATRKAQRKPVPNDAVEIMATWNNTMRGQDMIPNIETIDTKTYNAICKQVKSYGKETVISCIKKVTGLNSVKSRSFKMTFNKFITEKTLDIILTSNVKKDVESDWLDDYIAKLDDTSIIAHTPLENIPQFDFKDDAINWWNSNKNS